MVLYYGLLALETANNTVASAKTTKKPSATRLSNPGRTSDRLSLSRKPVYLSNSIGKMPSSSLSSSNSWIYTEDLRKRFEERYADCHYVFVPVYIDRAASAGHYHSTTAILSQKDRENSWIYSRPLRDHLYYSTSKISLPLITNISSSTYCVTNHGFLRDELPVKKSFRTRLFKRLSLGKEKSSSNLSSTSLPLTSFASSTMPFSAVNNLVKHRTSDVVEEDDEGVDDENHSTPLIKNDSTMSPSLPTSCSMTIPPQCNSTMINAEYTDASTFPTSISSSTESTIKHPAKHNNRLTRLRSFFLKSFSPSSSFSSHSRQRQQQQQTTLSLSSLSNRISRT